MTSSKTRGCLSSLTPGKPRTHFLSGKCLVFVASVALLCVLDFALKLKEGTRRVTTENSGTWSVFKAKESDQTTSGINMTKELLRLDPTIFAEIPRQTLPDFKNPCWYEKIPEAELNSNPYRTHKNCYSDKKTMKSLNKIAKHFRDGLVQNGTEYFRLRCLPYFYIIGMPKCGTSDLYHRLTKHPDVVGGMRKEPHYWTRRCFDSRMTGDIPNVTVPVREYLDLFDGAARIIKTQIKKHLTSSGQKVVNHDVITGEASVSTLYDNRRWGREAWDMSRNEPSVLVASLLQAVQPHARFILTIRDPTERLYSEYLYFTHGDKSAASFHDNVIVAIDGFNNCLKNNSVRSCTYEPNLVEKRTVRLRLGLYDVYLRDWFHIFPRDQILVQRLEDRSRDPRGTMMRVLEFLQLGPVESKSQENAIFTLNKKHVRKPKDARVGPMLPKTQRMLNEFYRPYNQQLADLLNDKRFLWLKESTVSNL
ncbi:carbohydrate sulfotransferase 15-like [Branchiostoma floridae]|uniref:Carbohydrate sulfotransferase 15-like n=1 Tax=Branchiostoma floridae TaxID=7739 RepID=A0A9J7HVK6_BRAFL|nr:carbohydrate sulfotransferase 15-like [Branchiostoma floridae]